MMMLKIKPAMPAANDTALVRVFINDNLKKNMELSLMARFAFFTTNEGAKSFVTMMRSASLDYTFEISQPDWPKPKRVPRQWIKGIRVYNNCDQSKPIPDLTDMIANPLMERRYRL